MLDNLCPEAALEQMSNPAVPRIEPTGILAIEFAHRIRQVCLARRDDGVIMRRHLAQRVTYHPKPISDFGEQEQECVPIFLVNEDRTAIVAARVHVIRESRVLDP